MATAQSAISSIVLRLTRRSQTSRSIGNISKRVHKNPHLYQTRPTTCRQGKFITQARFSQPFMSSSPNQSGPEQPTASIGMEWYDLSPERKIEWLLKDTDSKWGWVVYRTCYKPETDSAWETVKSFTETTARQRIAESDAPGIADKMDWVFVEDRESLDGASRQELKRRFRDWARTQNPGSNIDEGKQGRPSRYSFFIQVDEPALLSMPTGSYTYPAPAVGGNGRPYVKIVRAWEVSGLAEAAEVGNDEDWMKIQLDTLNVDFYSELDEDETWYTFYTRPDGICAW